ncbi:glycosyltransferase family 4 protein [Variovorax sp. LT1P1]|uniref:glycosyltransferase family 4 protein n=1 Tax=Variovorax sp. LT1P1 TaxID=3443730 RepID=UPI003F461379
MNPRTKFGEWLRTIREHRYRSLLKQSHLFDAKWYLEQNPDVPENDAFGHYLRYGGREGRAASAEFDSAWYMRHYEDVRSSGMNPLIHYLVRGASENRKTRDGRGSAEIPNPYAVESNAPLSEQELRDIETLKNTELFDPRYYLDQVSGREGLDPYLHFLRYGGFEGLKASENFDCGWYNAIYPDVVLHKVNPLLHYINYGIKEGRLNGISPRTAAVVRRTVSELTPLDPEIESCHPLHEKYLRLWQNFSIPSDEFTAVWSQIFHDLPSGIRHILFMPWLVKGGADLAGVNMLRAAQEALGTDATLLVLTDYPNIDAFDWLPSGSQVLVLSDYGEKISERNRQRIVEALIFVLRPASIMNVNSRACWDLIVEKGRAIRTICRVYAALFCRDFTADGRGAGYADTHLRTAIKNIDAIYFDTKVFIEEIITRYGLPKSIWAKLQFLPQPALSDLGDFSASAIAGSSGKLLWAGRFCYQKNTELLGRIIKTLPDISLDIYGVGEIDREEELKKLANRNPGVSVLGEFASFSSLPLEKYSAFIFTSRFEGMPTVLINAASAGIPIIASNVGGVSELVTNETGWLIDAIEDENAYCNAVIEVTSNPLEVARRQLAMREKLGSERSWKSFKYKLTSSVFNAEPHRHA